MRKLLILTGTVFVSSLLFASAGDVKAVWEKECAKCHGLGGKGDTKMGKKLELKDWTDPAVQAKMKDEEMAKTIKEGKKDGDKKMKAYGETVSEADAKELIKIIRAFKK